MYGKNSKVVQCVGFGNFGCLCRMVNNFSSSTLAIVFFVVIRKTFKIIKNIGQNFFEFEIAQSLKYF